MRKKGKNKLLEDRLQLIEDLRINARISECDFRVLDALARSEAGALSYTEAFEELTR